MGAGRAEHFLQNKRAFWIVGALTVILFLVTNLPWRLDDYDQAKLRSFGEMLARLSGGRS